jgi:hypothetical protein
MKKTLFVSLVIFVIGSPALFAQVSGQVVGTQCWIGGKLIGGFPANYTCPSSGEAASSGAASNPYAGIVQLGPQLGVALGLWLAGKTSNPQAELQKRQMMEELARREAEAERLHQEEEARRITAMYNRLYASLKLSGLPDLSLKGVGEGPGLALKLGDDAGAGTTRRSPGFYTDANGKIQLHGIDGLPGIYADGDGRNTGLQNSTLTLKTGEAAAASSTSPLPPTETGLQLRIGEGPTTPPAAPAAPAAPDVKAAPIDFSKLTPQQLADVAEVVSKLPPDEQQRVMAAAQRDTSVRQAGPGAATESPAPPSTPGQPMTPLNPLATGQVQAVAEASHAAAQAPGLEDASAKARVGFDTATGAGAVPLDSANAKPQILRGPATTGTPTPLPHSEDEKLIGRMEAEAAKLGWSAEKQAQLDLALNALSFDRDPKVTTTQIQQTWQSAKARGQDPDLAQAATQGGGLGFAGAGTQTNYKDCAVFAVAYAAGLPYGVVAARAAEIIRQGEWHSASDRANPEAVIEQRGLNGGEVIMLAESFGQAGVVSRQDFAKTLNEGRPIMVNVVPSNGDLESGHEIVLTKAFQHGGETWFEVMDSYQGPVHRLFLSSKELNNIVREDGVAFRPDAGTTPRLLRDPQ